MTSAACFSLLGAPKQIDDIARQRGALVVQSYFIPKGWCTVVATGGANSSDNAIGVREHANPAYRGLRLIPGQGPNPLQDAYFQRSMGVGVRHRGVAVAIRIGLGASYAAPVIELP